VSIGLDQRASSAGGHLPDPRVPALSISGVVKRFPGAVALGGVDLTVYAGEVHALLGANGAGKSTLIKILSRLYGYDDGTIEIGGEPFSRETAGRIAVIHQDLGLIDELTVADNIGMTAGFGSRGGIIRRAELRRRAIAALDIISSHLSPDEAVGELRRADKSMVAIARALVNPTDILILDEPTASLHDHEVGLLFDVIKLLRSRGTAIVYVSHRLDEVFRIADRITVMRDGLDVAHVSTRDTSPAEIVGAITGHRVLAPRTAAGEPGEVVVRADAVQVTSGAIASFALRSGEIVGAAGLKDAGHTEIGRALCGIEPVVAGAFELHGVPLEFDSPADALHRGVVFVTSNRESEGVAYDMTAQENMFLNPGMRQRSPLVPRLPRAERVEADAAIDQFGIRPADAGRIIATFSGGNQQKIILARCLSLQSEVVVLEEPTMGVDVGGKADIFEILRHAANDGKALFVLSTDFEELEAICDRVLVFDRGRIVGELVGDRITADRLIRSASGVSDE
jgi:ribose transport system ATP-binding protein